MKMPTSEQKKKITEDIFSATQKRLNKQGLNRTFYLKKLKELSDSENESVSLNAVKEIIKLWDDYPAEKHEHSGKDGGPIVHEHTIHKELAERVKDLI